MFLSLCQITSWLTLIICNRWVSRPTLEALSDNGASNASKTGYKLVFRHIDFFKSNSFLPDCGLSPLYPVFASLSRKNCPPYTSNQLFTHRDSMLMAPPPPSCSVFHLHPLLSAKCWCEWTSVYVHVHVCIHIYMCCMHMCVTCQIYTLMCRYPIFLKLTHEVEGFEGAS